MLLFLFLISFIFADSQLSQLIRLVR
jgi:hypothetical protein